MRPDAMPVASEEIAPTHVEHGAHSSPSAGAIGGRPRRLPSLLARASPARTRSAIIARSNSANTPII